MITEFKSGDYVARWDANKWKVSDPYWGLANISIEGTSIDFNPAGSYQFTVERLTHINIIMARINEQYTKLYYNQPTTL